MSAAPASLLGLCSHPPCSHHSCHQPGATAPPGQLWAEFQERLHEALSLADRTEGPCAPGLRWAGPCFTPEVKVSAGFSLVPRGETEAQRRQYLAGPHRASIASHPGPQTLSFPQATLPNVPRSP